MKFISTRIISRASITPDGVFMLGGAASGKNSVALKNYPNHTHIDPDTYKQSFPLYSSKPNEHGMFGPMGPATHEEFKKYSPDLQEASENFIQQNTPHKSVQDFYNLISQDPTHYGRGLTHAVSKFMARDQLQKSITSKTPFVYNTTGGEELADYADQAKENGMNVGFHHVHVPLQVALKRNLERPDRSVPDSVVRSTHSNVNNYFVPLLSDYAKRNNMPFNYTDNSQDNPAS